MIFRIEICEVNQIGGEILPDGRIAIFEGKHESEDTILSKVEMQLDEWIQEAEQDKEQERLDRLARVVGELLQFASGQQIDPMDIEYDTENGEAKYTINTPDGKADILVHLHHV